MANVRNGFLDSILQGGGLGGDVNMDDFLSSIGGEGGGPGMAPEPEPTADRLGGFMGSAGPSSGDEGQSAESPRDRIGVQPRPVSGPSNPTAAPPGQHVGTFGGNDNASPPQPNTPTPQAGSSTMIPFEPMSSAPNVSLVQPQTQTSYAASPNMGSSATPRLRGLFGGQGGLTGGGLGVPLDPISNSTSDPIDTLLSSLTSKRRTL